MERDQGRFERSDVGPGVRIVIARTHPMNSKFSRLSGLVNIRNFLVLVVLLSAGCKPGAVEAGRDRDGDCKLTGNVPGHSYCVTTFLQVLANPERYDGRRVRIQGWATKVDDGVVLFPSHESAESSETQASLVLRSGPAMAEILAHMASGKKLLPPIRLSVGGVFVLNRQLPGGGFTLSGPHSMRFGSLEQVDDW